MGYSDIIMFCKKKGYQSQFLIK